MAPHISLTRRRQVRRLLLMRNILIIVIMSAMQVVASYTRIRELPLAKSRWLSPSTFTPFRPLGNKIPL